MPPFPTSATISSCGKSLPTSSTQGGWNETASGPVAVSAAPCLSRQAGQRPSSAPEGSGAPHCGHFFSMPGLLSDSFIHPPQKQSWENVTKKVRLRSQASPKAQSQKIQNPEARACFGVLYWSYRRLANRASSRLE